MNREAASAALRPAALTAWILVAVASFHAAHTTGLGGLLLPCAVALLELSRAPTRRLVFYPMLGVGFLFYAPQLGFFWGIFGPPAALLWLVLAFWIGLFGLLLRWIRLRFGPAWTLALAPVVWTGLEFFRSELYYLRFGWLTFGMAHHANPGGAGLLGGYFLGSLTVGLGAVLVALGSRWPRGWLGLTAGVTVLFTGALQGLRRAPPEGATAVPVAGVQLEFPDDRQVLRALDKARVSFPQAQLFLLSEYTFQTPPPQPVRDWCATNRVYLVAGGKESVGDSAFHNMAYVIDTNGAIVHQQAKSVPIQFFQDGRPAPERRVWDSPWGRIGVLTCYDLSYTRVVNDFMRQGAVALLNPTMDVVEWGGHEHRLHACVAPLRAAEYRVPIFRVASSGISQLVDATGTVVASAPFPGEGEVVGGTLNLSSSRAGLPFDRWWAPGCVGLTVLVTLLAAVRLPSAGRIRACWKGSRAGNERRHIDAQAA